MLPTLVRPGYTGLEDLGPSVERASHLSVSCLLGLMQLRMVDASLLEKVVQLFVSGGLSGVGHGSPSVGFVDRRSVVWRTDQMNDLINVIPEFFEDAAASLGVESG